MRFRCFVLYVITDRFSQNLVWFYASRSLPNFLVFSSVLFHWRGGVVVKALRY